MFKRCAGLVAIVALLLAAVAIPPAHATAPGPVVSVVQATDSTGTIPPSGPILNLGTAIIGVGAALATGLFRKGAITVDGALGSVDRTVTKAVGPALPIITVGFAAVLPYLTNLLHLSHVPDAAMFVSAPASAIVGIAARELYTKLFGK